MSMVRVHHPVPKFIRCSFNRKGHMATNHEMGIQILHGGPDLTFPSSNRTGCEPPKLGIGVRIATGRPRRVGGVRSPRLPVTQETTGSKPVRAARVYVDVDKRLKSPVSQAGYSRVRIPPSTPEFHGAEHERLSALSFKQVTAG